MDDMKSRRRPAVAESLRHAYQPPPEPDMEEPAAPPTEYHHRPNASEPRTPNRKRRWPKVALIVILLIAIGFGVLLFRTKDSGPPFPQDITSGLAYPVYYSKNATRGYSYQPGSAKVKAGILFFTMTNGSKKIFITEQATPTVGVNLSSLPKHTNLDITIGKAVLGTGLGNPSIVIIAPSTLIQLTSSKGVTQADVISIAQKMSQRN